MRLIRSAVIAVGTITIVSCAASVAPSAVDVAGEFVRPHPIRYAGEAGWETAEVVDRITLSAIDAGKVAFHLEIVGPNYHTCEMEGTASRAGAFFEYHGDPADAVEGGGRCLLRIIPTGNTVAVEDVDSHCRLISCGARASIGRSEFHRR